MDHKRKTYRQEMAENTKKLLMKTATTLFHKHGYNNVTVSDIVKSAKVSRGSFYVHFKNKDDIIATLFVLEDKYLDVYENILNAPDNKGKNSLQLLELFLLGVNRIFIENGPELLRQYYIYSIDSSYILTSEEHCYYRVLHELIDKSFQNKLINDIYTKKQILELCVMYNRHIVLNWALHDGEYAIGSKDVLVNIFFKQIAA